MNKQNFKTEADLCAAFVSCVPTTWTVYPETCGFDIVLVHHETGAQIGVEAKLVLNAKVLVQITRNREINLTGPDFRAVLVDRVVAENAIIARRLGVKILTVAPRHNSLGHSYVTPREYPSGQWVVNKGGAWLPDLTEYRLYRSISWWSNNDWEDEAPVSRLKLPDYVPQVRAGVPAPIKLTDWMIQAIRMCVLVEKYGAVNRKHFQELKLHQSRWSDGWLMKSEIRGQWIAGPRFPAQNFRNTHPGSYAQIEADFPKWGAKLEKITSQNGTLI
jgi:hypothetical protein